MTRALYGDDDAPFPDSELAALIASLSSRDRASLAQAARAATDALEVRRLLCGPATERTDGHE